MPWAWDVIAYRHEVGISREGSYPHRYIFYYHHLWSIFHNTWDGYANKEVLHSQKSTNVMEACFPWTGLLVQKKQRMYIEMYEWLSEASCTQAHMNPKHDQELYGQSEKLCLSWFCYDCDALVNPQIYHLNSIDSFLSWFKAN